MTGPWKIGENNSLQFINSVLVNEGDFNLKEIGGQYEFSGLKHNVIYFGVFKFSTLMENGERELFEAMERQKKPFVKYEGYRQLGESKTNLNQMLAYVNTRVEVEALNSKIAAAMLCHPFGVLVTIKK